MSAEVVRAQQAEFRATLAQWPAPRIEPLTARRFSRRIAYTSDGGGLAAEIEVEFVGNHRRMEWGALWAATVVGNVWGGPTSLVPSAVLGGPIGPDASAPSLAFNSRYDPLKLAPLRRDGTVTFVADSSVATKFDTVAEYLTSVVVPLITHLVQADPMTVADVLERDGHGYRHPAATIAAVCVANDDLARLAEVSGTKRFRNLPDARAGGRERLLDWASASNRTS